MIPKRVAVLHLAPLPGSPAAEGAFSEVHDAAVARAVKEAKLLQREGFDGLILENFGDAPFFRGRVSSETVASFSGVIQAVCDEVDVPIGINVLRNDAETALALASVHGCNWIRVNVLSGMSVTDQGVIQGEAARLTRLRRISAEPVMFWADAQVKHAKGYAFETLEDEIEDLALRSAADAIILTGRATGVLTSIERLKRASEACSRFQIPLVLGSGATPEQLQNVRPLVHSIIVGSSLRRGGQAGEILDLKRVRAFVKADQKTKKTKVRVQTKARKKIR